MIDSLDKEFAMIELTTCYRMYSFRKTLNEQLDNHEMRCVSVMINDICYDNHIRHGNSTWFYMFIMNPNIDPYIIDTCKLTYINEILQEIPNYLNKCCNPKTKEILENILAAILARSDEFNNACKYQTRKVALN